MLRIAFDQQTVDALQYERLHHPHPRVQQKMWAVWLKSCELPHGQICRLVGISENTLRAYLRQYLAGGVEGLKKLSCYRRPRSELDRHAETIEAYFRRNPPQTASQARAVIEQLTGIKRSLTQVRQFLHRMGMKFHKVAAMPSKANPEVQQESKKSWNHVWRKPRRAYARCTSSTRPTSFSRPTSAGCGAACGHSF
jgi:transposase